MMEQEIEKARELVSRKKKEYIEPASSVALGVEQKCIIVLGDPEIGVGIHEYYANMIVRVTDFEKLLG